MTDDNGYTSEAVCCAECGTPIQEVEPEGWWAGELDSMKQEMEEMQCKLEVAEDEAEDAHDRCVQMKAEVRDARAIAQRDADRKNGRIADRLCKMVDVVGLMDAMINSPTAPTREELSTLNTLRIQGGLSSL